MLTTYSNFFLDKAWFSLVCWFENFFNLTLVYQQNDARALKNLSCNKRPSLLETAARSFVLKNAIQYPFAKMH